MEGLTIEYHDKDSPKLGYGTAYDQVERDYWNKTYNQDYEKPKTNPWSYGMAIGHKATVSGNYCIGIYSNENKAKPYKKDMTTTLTELKEELKQLPEIDLLELLEINSEDIVDRFEDWIDNKQDQLLNEIEEQKQEESDDTTE